MDEWEAFPVCYYQCITSSAAAPDALKCILIHLGSVSFYWIISSTLPYLTWSLLDCGMRFRCGLGVGGVHKNNSHLTLLLHQLCTLHSPHLGLHSTGLQGNCFEFSVNLCFSPAKPTIQTLFVPILMARVWFPSWHVGIINEVSSS
jgi:hypothetical protein